MVSPRITTMQSPSHCILTLGVIPHQQTTQPVQTRDTLFYYCCKSYDHTHPYDHTHTHQLLFSMLLNLDSPKAEAKVTRRAVRTIRNLQTGSTPLTSEIPYAYLQLWAHRQLSRSGHIPPVSTSVHLAHMFRP